MDEAGLSPVLEGEDPRFEPQRLQKFLARAGVASRRSCEEYIAQGRISVNGAVQRQAGTKVDPRSDVVCFDGKPIVLKSSSLNSYILLNKPSGYVTTMSDPQGRPTVASLVPLDSAPGLFPVGRLDRDTTGVLLFTNDGELGNLLLHPKRQVDKVYLADVQGVMTEAQADILRKGVLLDDGPCSPAKVEILKTRPGKGKADFGSSKLRICIHEGRNRQVKRMLKAVGHPVMGLERKSFAGITAQGLPLGSWRFLTEEELEHLRSFTE